MFNWIKSAIAPPKQHMLTTDVSPTDDSQILPNENISAQLNNLGRNAQAQHAHPMQMVQNHKKQLNQKAKIIGTQQNISFNNCNDVHIGSTIVYHMSRANSRKNYYNRNRGILSKTVSGKYYLPTLMFRSTKFFLVY